MSDSPMRITRVQITDVGAIKEADYTVDKDGALTLIGGENGAGKTTFINAAWSGFGPIPKGLAVPVRDGARKGESKVTFASLDGREVYECERTWDPKPGLRLTLQGVGKIDPPTQVLKDIVGAGFVDPLKFIQAEPREQRKILAKAWGVDFDGYTARKEDAKRTVKEKEAYQAKLKAKVEDLPWHDDAPKVLVSASDVTEKLNSAYQSNNLVIQAQQWV